MIIDQIGNINYYLIIIVIIELIVLAALILLILSKRIWIHFHGKKVARDKEIISQIVIDCLENKTEANPENQLKKFAFKEVLLSQVEAFDRRFRGEQWDKLKSQISKLYLLPRAREWVTSMFWLKRNFAARCFALSSFPEDEKSIFLLLDDPVFLVRSMAAAAAVKLEMKEGIFKIIRQMSQAKGYPRIFYRDILLQSKSRQIFLWIKEMAEEEKDLIIHLACLDLLSGITMVMTLPILREDLQSKNKDVRYAALKVFAYNPQVDSSEVLLKYMEDPNEGIRAEAAFGLKHFSTPATVEKLTKALSDPSWRVRVQAARSLKNMGKSDILNRQDPKINKDAYEAAHYVIQFW